MLVKILSLLAAICGRLNPTEVEDMVNLVQYAYTEGKKEAVGIRMTPDAFASIAKTLYNGSKIQAIKEVRAITGWGLRESKDWTDNLCQYLKGYDFSGRKREY